MFVKRVNILILMCFLTCTTKASTPSKKETIKNEDILNFKYDAPITLEYLIRMALIRNQNVELAKINLEIAKHNLDAQKSRFLPTIQANGAYSLSESDRIDSMWPFGGTYISKGKWGSGANGSINLSYNITNFGHDFASYKSVKYSLKSTEYSKDKMLQDIIYSIVEQYYQILSYEAKKQAAIEMENAYSETLKAAELKYEIGIVPLIDKLSAENSYSNSKMNSLESKNSLIKSKANLNLLLNLDSTYNLILENPKIELKKVYLVLDELIKEALKNRVDLKKLIEDKKKIAQELNATKTARYPSIDLRASTGGNKQLSPKLSSKVDKILFNNSASLSVTVPIFSGFSVTNSIKIKEKELKSINIKIEELKKEIANEVLAAYYDFETNQNKFFISKDLLRTATENAKVSFGMYKNGKSSILDVLNAQAKLEDAKLQFINSKYSWLIYRIKLLKAIGKLNIDNIVNMEKF